MPPMGRPKGQGTIVPDKPTPTGQKRWRVAVTMADGSRVYRRAPSVRDAERIRRQLVEARELDLDPTRQTVGDFLHSWIDALGKARNQRVRPNTLRAYRYAIDRILPTLGNRKVSALRHEHVQAWVDGLDASPASVRQYHSVLHTALGRAVRQRLLPWNPADGIELPRTDKLGVAKPLTLDEARRLIDSTAGDRLGPMWRLAIVTGMRSGELRGLSWDAVGAGWIEIREQLVRRPASRGGDAHGWGSAAPKVVRAVNRIAIDGETMASLEAHRRRLASEREPDWQYHQLVFLTPTGLPYHAKNLSDAFADACRAAGLTPRRVHDLRHTNLRLLHDLGVPEDVRMARAGHEEKRTQRGYAGASEAQDRLAADGLGRALTG